MLPLAPFPERGYVRFLCIANSTHVTPRTPPDERDVVVYIDTPLGRFQQLDAYFEYDQGGKTFTRLDFENGGAVLALEGITWITAIVTSIEVKSDPRTPSGSPTTRFPDRGAIQVDHALTHRVEWIRYEGIKAKDTGAGGTAYFFYESDGFPFFNDDPINSARGSMRTVFAGDTRKDNPPQPTKPIPQIDDRPPLAEPFPEDSVVLPVQASNMGGSDCFEPGDVATIIPDVISGTVRPTQVVIRYAANDGYPSGAAVTAPWDSQMDRWDTKNEWFAFTEQVPSTVAEQGTLSTLVIGRGWCGEDLSITGRGSQRQGRLPTFESWTGLSQPGLPGEPPVINGEPRLVLFDQEPVAERQALPTAGVPAPRRYDVAVDALVAGDQGPDRTTRDRVRSALDQNQPRSGDLGGCGVIGFGRDGTITSINASETEFYLVATLPLFRGADPQKGHTGLAWFDGEVIAYALVPPNAAAPTTAEQEYRTVRVVGRGLLGTNAREHRLPSAVQVGSRTVRAVLPIQPLPYGPVAVLTGDPDGWNVLRAAAVEDGAGPRWDAPAALIMRKTGGAEREVVQFIEPKALPQRRINLDMSPAKGRDVVPWQYRVPRWMRGLYNTPQVAWGAGDIALGWWPRFPSALPSRTGWSGLAPAELAAALRCRAYQWAGFPVGFHRMRVGLDPDPMELRLAHDESALPTGGTGRWLRFELRTLATGLDWTTASQQTLVPDAFEADPRALLRPDPFGGLGLRPLDGIETRVFVWYDDVLAPSSDLGDITGAGGQQYLINDVRLRVRAPALVLSGDPRP
jgi:hypothetical protein